MGKQGTIPGAPPPGPEAGAPARRGPIATGTVIDGKYAVARVLGQGGMGIVYLARDIHTGLDVVVKSVRRELAHRPDVRQRTLAEGRVLAQIDHPNVVQLKAVVVEAQDLWLVMQYIDGESLDKTIAGHSARGEPMPIGEALRILRQIAAGVGAAHEEGVIHRDLKPANVLLRRKDGVVKVTDFGIAKVPADTNREQTKGIIGSLWYMSPEQVVGRRDLDRRVDIYALGIVLYQMLVGAVPFDAESDYEIMKMHAEAPMPAASAARPDVPAAIDTLIQRACAKNRDARIQSCEELIAAIDRIAAPTPATRTVPEAPAPAALAMAGPGATTEASGELGASPQHARTTAHGAVIPSRVTTRSGATVKLGWVAGAGAGLLAVGATLLFALGLVPGIGPRRSSKPLSSQEVKPVPAPSASEPAGAAEKSPLLALAGAWVANGKDLDAVLVGDVLEFRVRTPAQFEPQDYDAGEARFALRALPEGGAGGFAVEDRIRPLPPSGLTYDPRARNTCQEVWTTAGGEPLRARFEGTRLDVELAKIEPSARNFIVEDERVTSCLGLRNLKAARVVNTLSRP